MKNILLAGLLALTVRAVPAELEARATTSTCNRDNCFRAVFATSPATRMAAATTDCAKFQTTTVTACTSTINTTPTSVITAISQSISFLPQQQQAGKRDICIPTTTSGTVPAYASQSCTASGTLSNRFASACSCSGFTSTTVTSTPMTTVVFPTTTITTSTVTTTVIASPTSDCQRTLLSGGPDYTADSGVVFTLTCAFNYQGYHDNIISGSSVPDFKTCANACGANDACNAFDFYNGDLGTTYGTCYLLKSILSGNTAADQPGPYAGVDGGFRKSNAGNPPVPS